MELTLRVVLTPDEVGLRVCDQYVQGLLFPLTKLTYDGFWRLNSLKVFIVIGFLGGTPTARISRPVRDRMEKVAQRFASESVKPATCDRGGHRMGQHARKNRPLVWSGQEGIVVLGKRNCRLFNV